MTSAELTNAEIVERFLSRVGVTFTAASAGWRDDISFTSSVAGHYVETRTVKQSIWKCVFKRPGKQWTVRFHMGSAHKDPPTAYQVLYSVVADWWTNENNDYEGLGFDGEELDTIRKATERQSERFDAFFRGLDDSDIEALHHIEDLACGLPDTEAVERAALLGEEE